MNKKYNKISKFLSLILRHKPETVNVTLDKNGWVDVNVLIQKINQHSNESLTLDDILYVVENNDKKRFNLSDDKTKIRASQGHSIEVNLGLVPQIPPDILYHGTKKSVLGMIKNNGVKKMSRQHVHLSATTDTATNVASRRKGESVILSIDAKAMIGDGINFFISDNNVWLVDHIPFKYVTVMD